MQDRAEHVAERNDETAMAGGITQGVRALDSHQPKVFSQASMRHGGHHSGSPAINGGSAAASTNGVASTDSTPLLHSEHTPQPSAAAAECNGFSSFVLRSTFASGIIVFVAS